MKNTISINANFDQCLKRLDIINDKILIVINSKNKLVGTITDGDVRRYILQKKVNRKISEVMNKNPKYITNEKEITILKFKKKFRNIIFLPIVDDNKKYIKYLNLSKPTELNDTAVVILAGGKGERLNPVTKTLPKPMLIINEKPLLINLLLNLKLQNFKNFYISVNYLQKKIIDPVKKFSNENDLEINFLKEKEFLGTAGPISLIKKKYKNYLIINSDIVTNLNYKNLIFFHENKDSDFTICTKSYENKIQFGVLEINNNKITNIKEKPIVYYDFCCGIYVINQKVLSQLTKNKKIDMPELIKKSLKKKLKIAPYMLHEYWKDIGTKENLLDLNKFYSKYFI